ncbi:MULTISPECIES: pentapeptide repeat-containing protein [Rhodococcus]|uniref:pentapeptide repeat-containing protein n=1 Tax=Rhodococcus TaxID=1827 RepID=UPI003525062E
MFDCFGAGQAVSQRLFAGVSRRDRPDTRYRMFSAFAVVKELHEMMWHLLEAQQRTYDPELADDARELVESLAVLTRRGVDELESLEIGEIRASVRPVLMEVSAEVRGSYFADDEGIDPDLVPGADLAGTDLRGHRLCGADLRNALLIGADLRGCDLAGADLLGADLRGARVEDADLSLALYLTGPQLAAAHGNRRTRVPTGIPVPRSRLDD